MTVDGQPLTMSFDYEREAEEWLSPMIPSSVRPSPMR